MTSQGRRRQAGRAGTSGGAVRRSRTRRLVTLRTGVATALALLWVLVTALSGVRLDVVAPASAANPTSPAVSADGRLSLLVTVSPSTVVQGGSVTYTYTVKNATTSTTLQPGSPAVSDPSCSPISPTATSLAPGATQVFSCTRTLNQTTTSTASARYTYTYTCNIWFTCQGTSSVSQAVTVQVNAIAQQPIDCTTPTVWVAQNTGSNSYTSLFQQYTTATSSTFIQVDNNTTWGYNALAYNPVDKYLYAVSNWNSVSRATYKDRLLRIDGSGTIVDFGPISGLGTDGAYTTGGAGGINAGAISATGIFYFANMSASGSIYQINLGALPASPAVPPAGVTATTKYTGTPGVPPKTNDFAVIGGSLYGIQNVSPALPLVAPTLYAFNLTTNTWNSGTTVAGLPSDIYGAAWSYGNGNLGVDTNTQGKMAQVTTAGALVNSVAGPTSSNNDGASCVDNNSVDLAVAKTATPTVALNGTVTFTLTVTNNGSGVSSGGLATDTVPSQYTSVAVNTTAYPNCAVSGNKVTCQNGVLNPGDSYQVQITAKAPNAAGCITNTASVAGNEADPVPANNTSSAPTCVTNSTIDVAKAAAGGTVTGPDANGNFTATYTVTVKHSGTDSVPGSYGPVTDQPQFTAGASIVSFTWSGGPNNVAPTTISPDANGIYTFGTAGTAIASAATHTYTVTVVLKQAPTAAAPLTLCNGTAAGSGLYNTVGADGESASAPTTNNMACVNPAPAIDVVKTVRKATDTGNGVDSLTVNRGDQVVYVYAVSLATGYTEPLKTVTVTDDKLGTISGLASPAGYKSGDTNANGQLDAGETWLYWSAATAPANSVDNIGTATGTGVTTSRAASDTDPAHLTVLFPTIDLTKTAGAVTGPDANGVYTAAYTVTVTNTGTGAGSYGPITDTLGFDPSFAPKTATWTKGATSGPTTTFGSAPYSFTVGSTGATSIAAGATDTYAVSVTFTYPGASAASACAGSGTGLFNSVALPAGQETNTGNNSACDTPPARFSVQKAAQGGAAGGTGSTVQTAADGTATVTYTVTVTNTGGVAAKHPAVTDSVTLPTGFAVTSVTLNGVTQTLTSGSFTIPASGTNLAAGATTTYTVVVTGKAADLTAVDWTKAGTCSTANGGNAAAGGFFNVVSMNGDSDGANTNDACAPVTRPTTVIKVQKLGTTCAAGVSTCPLAGASFAIYATDPAQAGATPIANGITADVTSGSTFTSTALGYPATYWLVETRAPSGYQLLATPIRFTLGANGITLVGAPTSVTLAPGTTTTVRVVDNPSARLPAAGGGGPLPTTLAGLLLVALGAAYHLRRSGRRASGLTP